MLPGVTEDSLKKYELAINRPPNIVVAMMADAYNAPELRPWYCANECPLGKDCREVPEMPPERTSSSRRLISLFIPRLQIQQYAAVELPQF